MITQRHNEIRNFSQKKKKYKKNRKENKEAKKE